MKIHTLKTTKPSIPTDIEELESVVSHLPAEKLAVFRDWFYQFENDSWDKQIASDFKAGKLNKLIDKARLEFSQGKAREL